MPLKFNKANNNEPTEAKAAKKTKAKKKTKSHLMSSSKASQLMEQEEQRIAASSGAFRFYLKAEADATITFLDGDLDSEGVLDIPYFQQHTVKLNGRWENFVCVADDEPCPLCETDQPAIVGALTVLDHTEYTDKEGKVHTNQIRLFIAKRKTLKLLQKKAAKHGGLTGCTFDVTRTGAKEPNVGNDYDFDQKNDLPDLQEALGLEELAPLNYEEEIKYLSGDELRALGIGSAAMPGNEPALKDEDYEDDM